jgi:two-component system LytT family response regulator/two-component system response regulator LytT
VITAKSAAAATAATISTVLVDDEKLAREELSYLLRDYRDIEIVGSGENGLDAIRLIENLEPDIVFLDVQMPGLDGLGVIRKLRERDVPQPYFILATAYDQYAVEAFRLEALDYLLKPVEKERLSETLDRARRFLAAPTPSANVAIPSEAAHAVEDQQEPAVRNKLVFRASNRNLIIDARDLIYATIDDGIITAVSTTTEGLLNYKTLEELQSNLDSEAFWRAHRSYLVNIHRIREVVPWFNSSFQLRMDDKKQTEIPVSRVQTKRLRTLFRL